MEGEGDEGSEDWEEERQNDGDSDAAEGAGLQRPDGEGVVEEVVALFEGGKAAGVANEGTGVVVG